MVWNVMGQIYIPKQVDQNRMWWEAIIPEETYIPPHSHSTQDEFLYLTEGELDMLLDGEEKHVVPGEIIPFPRYSNPNYYLIYFSFHRDQKLSAAPIPVAIIGGTLNGRPRNTAIEIMTAHIAEKPIAAPKRIAFWLSTPSTLLH